MPSKLTSLIQKDRFCIAIIAVVSLVVLLPIIIGGLSYGHDLPHHYQCAMTFVESIRSGDFYPSWSLNRNLGYGGMETRLYPPVSHYVLALAYIAASDWHLATDIALYLFTFLGGLGIYLWAREYFEPMPSAFAGSIFLLLPYHLTEIYNSYFYAEYAGIAILPFTFLFVSRVYRRGSVGGVIGLGSSFAALVLTHLPLTVIGSICLVIYGVSLIVGSDGLSNREAKPIAAKLFKLAAGAAIGLAASSFFWIKVIEERGLLAKTANYADPFLDYRIQFLLTPLQDQSDPFMASVIENSAFYDLMLLCAVVLAAAFGIPFLLSLKDRAQTDTVGRHAIGGIVFIFVMALFLTTPFSRPLWDRFGLLQEVQFPWRWLGIVCVTAPLIAAGGILPLIKWFGSARRRPFALIITGCLLAIIAFSAFQIVRPAKILSADETAEMMKELPHKEGLTFWWTIWARKEALRITDKVFANDRGTNIERWEAKDRSFTVEPGPAEDVRIAVFYHPDWKATVDGRPVETRPADDGALLVPISADRSAVKVDFVETQAVKTSQIVSLVFWAAILIVFPIFYFIRRRFPEHTA